MILSALKRSAPFAVVAAVLFAGSPVRAASFDGPWTVVIVTQSGNCDAAYSFPVNISGGRLASTGGATIGGRIGGNGVVSVAIPVAGLRDGPAGACPEHPDQDAGAVCSTAPGVAGAGRPAGNILL